jgi:hypothetical protein
MDTIRYFSRRALKSSVFSVHSARISGQGFVVLDGLERRFIHQQRLHFARLKLIGMPAVENLRRQQADIHHPAAFAVG